MTTTTKATLTRSQCPWRIIYAELCSIFSKAQQLLKSSKNWLNTTLQSLQSVGIHTVATRRRSIFSWPTLQSCYQPKSSWDYDPVNRWPTLFSNYSHCHTVYNDWSIISKLRAQKALFLISLHLTMSNNADSNTYADGARIYFQIFKGQTILLCLLQALQNDYLNTLRTHPWNKPLSGTLLKCRIMFISITTRRGFCVDVLKV